MPRRNRRRPDEPVDLRGSAVTDPLPAPEGWTASAYKGVPGTQTYVCPRCRRYVARSSAHVVAWRTDEDERHRHWHSACWRSAVKEGVDRYRFG